jgi:hypothetical protein
MTPATAATAPARATCWTTTTTYSARSRPSGRPTAWARQARHQTVWALWSSGAATLLAAVARRMG